MARSIQKGEDRSLRLWACIYCAACLRVRIAVYLINGMDGRGHINHSNSVWQTASSNRHREPASNQQTAMGTDCCRHRGQVYPLTAMAAPPPQSTQWKVGCYLLEMRVPEPLRGPRRNIGWATGRRLRRRPAARPALPPRPVWHGFSRLTPVYLSCPCKGGRLRGMSERFVLDLPGRCDRLLGWR